MSIAIKSRELLPDGLSYRREQVLLYVLLRVTEEGLPQEMLGCLRCGSEPAGAGVSSQGVEDIGAEEECCAQLRQGEFPPIKRDG